MTAFARAAWGTLLLALGGAFFVLITFAWALVALVLSLILPAHSRRKAGRRRYRR